MANLTISVPDDILERARARALAQGTSVNRLVSEQLEAFARPTEERARLLSELFADAAAFRRKSPGSKRPWTRDELHER